MSERVKNIDVVTRIEGHSKITFVLDSGGEVQDACFHVLEFKGFEKFMLGRMLYDAPRITTRACGICPVSHHLASAKACDDLLNVEIPETAKLLRELMHMAQMIHSHSLHFFLLAAPDFILGPDAPPQERNVVGLLKKDPELVKNVIKIRKFGQNLIQLLGGKAIHPVTAIPGGMSKGMSQEEQATTQKELSEIMTLYEELQYIAKSNLLQYADLINSFSVIETNFLGLSNNGKLELYDGDVRACGKDGSVLFDIEPNKYFQAIAEHAEPWTYLKFPYLKDLGYPEGVYRVGPLARINNCESTGFPKSNKLLSEFRTLYGKPANGTLVYHQARLIELLYVMERAEQILQNPALTSNNYRVKAKRNAGEGIGIVEAPRGTLIHHYKANSSGKLTDVNLIVATVNNNAAINKSVKAAAQGLIRGGKIEKDGLNKVEMAVRAYDPCLTCAAHNFGEMFSTVEFVDLDGKVLYTKKI